MFSVFFCFELTILATGVTPTITITITITTITITITTTTTTTKCPLMQKPLAILALVVVVIVVISNRLPPRPAGINLDEVFFMTQEQGEVQAAAREREAATHAAVSDGEDDGDWSD